MKSDIHPKVRDVIFQDTVTGACFKVLSTIKTEATIALDGKDYPLVKVDVSSSSHPFYTGTMRILDTAGRVERFGTKYGGANSLTGLLKKKPAAK